MQWDRFSSTYRAQITPVSKIKGTDSLPPFSRQQWYQSTQCRKYDVNVVIRGLRSVSSVRHNWYTSKPVRLGQQLKFYRKPGKLSCKNRTPVAQVGSAHAAAPVLITSHRNVGDPLFPHITTHPRILTNKPAHFSESYSTNHSSYLGHLVDHSNHLSDW